MSQMLYVVPLPLLACHMAEARERILTGLTMGFVVLILQARVSNMRCLRNPHSLTDRPMRFKREPPVNRDFRK